MAGSLSDFMELELIDHVLKVGSYAQPTNLFLALVTTLATDASIGGTLVEPASNYARVAAETWTAAASRATDNNGAITFVEATGSWGTIVGWAIVDSASGAGNVIAHGDFSVSKAINLGDTAFVADADLDISWVSGGLSTYLADALLDHSLKGTPYSVPTNVYCALTTVAITDAMTGSTITEPASNYARTVMNVWDAAAAGASENTNAITFPEATASWGTIGWTCLCDAATVGNVLFYSGVDTSKAIDSGDTAEWVAGAWDITMN